MDITHATAANSDHTPAEPRRAGKLSPSAAICRHCLGTGHEPPALRLTFSREGSRRGELTKLARAARVSESMVSATFSGNKLPSIRTLHAIASALSRIFGHPVTVDRLIRIPAIWRMVTGKRTT